MNYLKCEEFLKTGKLADYCHATGEGSSEIWEKIVS